MNQKEGKGKGAPPSSSHAMAFDPAHLLGMHSMAAAGLPYGALSPFQPSPYSLLGQPPPFPTAAAAAMFGGLNPLNPMANPLHAAALSHSLAAASLYGLPKQSGDLGSPPPPSHLLPPPSSTPSSSAASLSASSSSSSRKGKSSSSSSSSSSKAASALLSSSSSAHTPPSNSPSPSSLAHHQHHSSTSSAAFYPFDSAAAAAAAMHPYLPGWALNGSAYHMTQLANQMAEAHKRTESHHQTTTNKSSSSSSLTQPSSSLSSSANRSSNNKSRSSVVTTSSSGSNHKPRTSSPSSSYSRKIPPSAHQHESKNSHHSRSGRSSSPPSSSSHHHPTMLNIPLSGGSTASEKLESKKSSSTSSSSSSSRHHHPHLPMGDGLELHPRSMITPYHLPPELAYLSQSLLLHRPDLAALHTPFMTPPSSASVAATSSSSSSTHPSMSTAEASAATSVLEPGQLRSLSAMSSSSSSSSLSSSKRKKEDGRSDRDHHQSKESEHQHPHHPSTSDATTTPSSSSSSASSSSTSTSLPFDLSQSSSTVSASGEQHSMDNIRKKKIADQIRKRMAAGGEEEAAAREQQLYQQEQQLASNLKQQEQLQQQAMLEAVMAGGGLSIDLFAAAAASGYGLSQSDWLGYLAKEKNRLGGGGGKSSSSTSSNQGKESSKSLSLEASLQQQEEELKELQKKYALAVTNDGAMDLQKGSKSDGDNDPDNTTAANEDSISGSESEGSGRDTPKRGTDSADSASPVKKRCYQTDERELVIPLEHGWNRQTVINGMGRRGIVGDVYYFAPCGKKLKTIPDVMRYLERNPNSDLARENFSFNTKVNVGQFYEVRGGLTSAPVPLTDTEVLERIEMSRGKRARMQMLARKKREKVAREQALARQIMENKLKRKLELQDMSRRAAEMRFEKKLEKQKQKETERKLKEDKALSKQKEKEQKQQERVRLQEQLRKEKELRAQQIIEARNRRQQELEEMRLADTVKRTQERELKRQQLIMLKEQERERRRQHILLIKALEQRKKQEEKQNKERMREEKLNEKLKLREIRMSQRKVEMEVAQELKKPIEDMELKNQKPLPEFPRMESRLAGRPVADCLMVVEFLNNFGSALNLEKNSVPTLQSLENGLIGDSEEEVEELMSLVMHLLRFAIDDVGVPNPKEAVTKLNQKIVEMEMTDSTMSEILRIFIKARGDKQLSNVLKDKPMEALNPTHKAAILAFLCNELLTSKVITSEIDKHMEGINNLRRDKWIVEGQLRQLRVFQAKKFNKIHRSTMDRRRNNSTSNNSNNGGVGGNNNGGVGGGDDDSIPPSGKMGGGSDDEEEDKDDEEGSGNESDGSTSAPISSANTNLNNMPFEPVDDSLTLDESDKRIENLQKQHLAYRQQVFRSSLRLRAINIGQDRYKRTFWILPMTRGVFVEGMESGEPEDYVEEKERKIKKEKEEEEEKKLRKEREAMEAKEEKGKEENNVKKEGKEGEDGEIVKTQKIKGEAGNDGEKEGEEECVDKEKSGDEKKKDIGNEVEIGEKSMDFSETSCDQLDNDTCDEDDSTMDDGNNDVEDEEDEDNDDNEVDEDDNETSNMTGPSENASWTDSDFNDSNLSFGGFKMSASPVRSSSVKVTVDMNGAGPSDDESSHGIPTLASNVRKNLGLSLENGIDASSTEAVAEASESKKEVDKAKKVFTEEKSSEDLNETVKDSNNVLKKTSSVISNGMSHADEFGAQPGNGEAHDSEIEIVQSKELRNHEDGETHDSSVKANSMAKDSQNLENDFSAVNGFGFAKDKEVVNLSVNSVRSDRAGDTVSNCNQSESSSVVDMTKIDERLDSIADGNNPDDNVEDKLRQSASSICVDLSISDRDRKTLSPPPPLSISCDAMDKKNPQTKPSAVDMEIGDRNKTLPATDILRVPRIGQSRETSLFSMLNHQTSATTSTTGSDDGTNKASDCDGSDLSLTGSKSLKVPPQISVSVVSTAEKGKGLSLLKPNNSILSSSLLFSPSSLSPTSPSSSVEQQTVATDLKMPGTSSTSLSSTTHSSNGKKVNGTAQDLNGAAVNFSTNPYTSPAPRPAHSKAIKREALPPFHPSAVVNPCLSETPPAAHSSHAHDKSKPPLHLSLKVLDHPPPTRSNLAHFHQTPPHSFNNPALSVNLYGDTPSASQALSSLASFASPPPAHQHRSASSSLLTSTPKALTSTTTSTNTTSAASAASSKSFKPGAAYSSIIDEVLKNEPEYSSSQLLHHAASQVRRSGVDKDLQPSPSSQTLSTPTSSKTPPLSKLPLTSSELSSLITSAILSSSPSSSTAESDSKDDAGNINPQHHPMWFSLLPRTPCDELSLTRQTNKTPTASSMSPSSSSSMSSSTDLAAVAASLLLNSSSASVTSLLNTLSSSAAGMTSSSSSSPSSSHSALSLENLLSLLQSNPPMLHESPSQSPTPGNLNIDHNSSSSFDFKVPQPPLDPTSLSASPAGSASMQLVLNYDPWDLLRAAQGERQFIPPNKQHGWWRIFDLGQMKKITTSTMNRGIREHNLQRAVQRYLDYARGHVTYDSSIGETDPNADNSSKTSNDLKRKSPHDSKSPSCSPAKKEKKSSQDKEEEMDDDSEEKNNEKEEKERVADSNDKKNEGDSLSEAMDADEDDENEKKECKDSSQDKAKQIKEEENVDDGVVEVKKEIVDDGNEGEGCDEDDDKKAGVKDEVEEEEEIDFVTPDKEDCWSADVMHEIEMAAVEDVEALEDRIYHASLQAKSGWKPNRETGLKLVDRTVKEVKDDESYPLDAGIARLLELEANIERRYLKPPLSRSVSLNMSNMGTSSGDGGRQQEIASYCVDVEEEEDVPPGLLLWRQAVIGSESPAQLSLCTQLLSKSVSWEKSIMRVICQNCRKDDNEAELLLCDGCDKGFHTYCFKPKMENIPEGDWYCFECVSKASGTPHCGLCGNKGGRLAHCSKCPRYIHLDCLDPPLPRVPKRWQCANCLCDKPGSKRSRKRKESLPTVQRITKLVVKEEPVDADDFLPGETTPRSTPPIPSSTLSSSSIKEEPSTSINSPARRSDPKQTLASTTPTANNASTASSPSSSPLSPPEKKRRKRKEKEPQATATAAVAMVPVEQKGSTTHTTSSILSSHASNSPVVSFPSLTPDPASPLSSSSPAKKKRQRKTKAEREAEAATAAVVAAAASGSGGKQKGGVMLNEDSHSPSPTTVVVEKYTEKERTKDMTNCGKLLGELENHDLGWPFLKPVNKKQFPSYKKFIKTPMDFTTIRNRVKAKGYKHRQDFATDVRLVFDNCETFNEDESEVGQAGHNLRQVFERKWSELFPGDGL